MSIDECFWICWDEVEKFQWQTFSFEHVARTYPHLPMDMMRSYFPEKTDFLRFFLQLTSQKIPFYEGLSTKDLCFEAVMARLEALSFYKKSVLDIFLNSTSNEKYVVVKELYSYFSTRLQGAVLPYPVPFYAWGLVGVYSMVFPAWATRSNEEVMIYLDQLLSKMLSFVE